MSTVLESLLKHVNQGSNLYLPASAMQDSRSNWMEGYLCMSVYLIIAVAVRAFSLHLLDEKADYRLIAFPRVIVSSG